MNEGGPFGFDTGVGTVTTLGTAWGARVGVEFLRWFAIDAHYIGMRDHANGLGAPNGSVSLLTSAVTGEARFTLPTPFVQPYLFVGAGVYSTSITGSDGAKAASPLYGSTEFGMPIGIGANVSLGRALTIGPELTYHRLFGEAFADDDEIGGGDFLTFNLVLRARL